MMRSRPEINVLSGLEPKGVLRIVVSSPTKNNSRTPTIVNHGRLGEKLAIVQVFPNTMVPWSDFSVCVL